MAIHDGTHSLIELKASVSRGDVEHFQRKIAFYEQEEDVEVKRVIIISPMFDRGAKEMAQVRGMEVYSSVYDVSRP